ncbi:reverse transcriptase domain, reverse transcriptase zinc-binding domain protein [Tanacetum coccineum]
MGWLLAILHVLPFEEGILPVKYMGVPLVSSHLIFCDCQELIEKVKHRISDWKNKSLPTADIEQLMRGFLWNQGNTCRGKSKVAWEVVCLPKKKSGLGVRHINAFNKALITSHIWSILTLKESLWVKWIHAYKSSSDIVSSLIELVLIFRLRLEVLGCMDKEFYVASVWDNIRPRGTSVDGHDVVWFTCCIPRHAFNLWLFIKRKLKTQDLLRHWDVWDHMKIYDGLPSVVASLDSIVTYLIPISQKRFARIVIAKLVLAASCYFIWHERNCRLFKNQKRSQDQIIEVIKCNVRLKLVTCKFKSTTNVKAFLHLWKLLDSLFQSPY